MESEPQPWGRTVPGPGCRQGTTDEQPYSTFAGKEGVHLRLVIFRCAPGLEEEQGRADTAVLLSQCKKKSQLEFGYFKSRVRHPLRALII